MQMRIKTLLKDSIIYIAIGLTLLIGFLSLIKLPEISGGTKYIDKLEHIIAYYALTLSWLISIKPSSQKIKLRYLIALGCFLYGTIIELLQVILTTYRTASFLDILANLVGIIVASLVFKLVEIKK